jgi:hypothetical protein
MAKAYASVASRHSFARDWQRCELASGDTLEPSWDYRDAYSPPDLAARRPADGSIRVVGVVADGEGETFSAPIRETGKFFATCGVLLKS